MAELDRVQSVNSSVQLQNPTGYTLQSFVGSLAEEIVNVRGSLTTPPCSPANWLVATQVREVSRNDVSGRNYFYIFFYEFYNTILLDRTTKKCSSEWRSDCSEQSSVAAETEPGMQHLWMI